MDVLDQSEIDALLAMSDSVEAEDEAPQQRIFSRTRRDLEGVEVRAYDFKRPERVSKDQMIALHTLHESFARNFGAAMSGFLRTIVEVKVATCEQMTYQEFTSGLPNPTCFNLIEADALDGQMCLEISPLIIYPIIDRLLGGTSQELFIPQRPMTTIETRIIGNVTSRALTNLAEAWAGVREMTLSITATESNPQLVQIVPPNEVAVVVSFELRLANRAGIMNLCIPFNVIEPVMEELSAQSWFSASRAAASPAIRRNITQSLDRAPVRVAGVLAETTISVRDLLSLEPGDLITTGRPASAAAVVEVEGQRKFSAEIGRYRSSRALKILRQIGPRDRV